MPTYQRTDTNPQTPQVAEYRFRFSIWNVLGLTTVCCAVLGAGRLLGPQLSWSFFLAAYAFAPALAMLTLYLMRTHPPRIRYTAAALTMVFFAVSMMLLCGMFYGGEAVLFVLAGTLIEWPGQLGVLICLRWLGHSQSTLRKHGIDQQPV